MVTFIYYILEIIYEVRSLQSVTNISIINTDTVHKLDICAHFCLPASQTWSATLENSQTKKKINKVRSNEICSARANFTTNIKFMTFSYELESFSIVPSAHQRKPKNYDEILFYDELYTFFYFMYRSPDSSKFQIFRYRYRDIFVSVSIIKKSR